MMRALTQDEYETELLPIAKQLTIELRGDRMRETYFTDRLPSRHIIYPCEAQLDENLVSALVDIMRSVHDSGLYVDFGGRANYVNCKGTLETTPSSYYYVSIDQVEYAFNDEGIAQEFMDNAKNPVLFIDRYTVYSAQKRWVMVIDQEAHCALLGGDEASAELLALKCTQVSRPIQEFLSYWEPDVPFTSSNLDLEAFYAWIPRMLIHVYGQRRAMNLLRESHFLVD